MDAQDCCTLIRCVSTKKYFRHRVPKLLVVAEFQVANPKINDQISEYRPDSVFKLTRIFQLPAKKLGLPIGAQEWATSIKVRFNIEMLSTPLHETTWSSRVIKKPTLSPKTEDRRPAGIFSLPVGTINLNTILQEQVSQCTTNLRSIYGQLVTFLTSL